MHRVFLVRRVTAGALKTTAFCLAPGLFGAVPAAAQQQQLRTEWSKNVTEYRGQNDRRVTLVCPPGGKPGDVWGTDSYTDDSSVCTAAAHAGVIGLAKGGVVTIVIGPGGSSYAGSTRNGVTSRSFGRVPGSFSVERGAAEGQVDWMTSANGLSLAGGPITVVCPPGGTSRNVWGTDRYTGDSSICTAAVHAGRITLERGGRVTISDAPAPATYEASARNGISSQAFANFPTSFQVAGLAAAKPALAARTTRRPVATTGPRVGNEPADAATGARSGTAPRGTERALPRTGIDSAGLAAAPRQNERLGAGSLSRGAEAASAQANDPPAVHASGFKASAGYGMNFLSWKPAPGAVGYRLARSSWDPARQAFIQGSDVEIPARPVADSAGLIRDTAFVDQSVNAGTQYVYWLGAYFKSGDGSFYFPTSGQYPSVTVNPRDPAEAAWMTPSAQREPAPTLVRAVPSATGLFIEWQPKSGVVGYVMLRSRIEKDYDIRYMTGSAAKCYPHVLRGFGNSYIIPSNSINLPFKPDVVRRFCIGIFAIYPNTLINGHPGTYAFSSVNGDAWATHHPELERSLHSKGLFIIAEWDTPAGKWKVLPEGSMPIDPCITGNWGKETACIGY